MTSDASSNSNNVHFNRKEIFFIFTMLIVVSTLIFALGVFVGKEYKVKVLQKQEASPMIEVPHESEVHPKDK